MTSQRKNVSYENICSKGDDLMIRRIGRFTFFTVLLTMFFCALSTANASDDVKIYINGVRLNSESNAYIENGRTMVPARSIFEALGANVIWDQSKNTVTAKKDNVTVKLIIGEKGFTVDSQKREMDAVPVIINGTTYVPARAVSQAFGADVAWMESIRAVSVTTDGVSVLDGYPTVLLPNMSDGTISSVENAYGGVKYSLLFNEDESSFAADGLIEMIARYEKCMENIGWQKSIDGNPNVLLESVFRNNTRSDCGYEVRMFVNKTGNGAYELYIFAVDHITVYNIGNGEVRHITESEYILESEYRDSSFWKRSVGADITVYDAYNNPTVIKDYELYKYLAMGMTTEMKTVIMYTEDNSEIKVGVHLVERYRELGYYIEPVIKLYSPYGTCEYIGRSKMYEKVLEGWSEKPFETELYSHGGKTVKVYLHEKDKYIAEGWYEELLVPMYFTDGSVTYINALQKDYYIACGWSEHPVKTPEQVADDIIVVYITPHGKKYHISKKCAGEGAVMIPLHEASSSYEPCRTCCE